MSVITDTIEAGGVTPPATVKVWDPFVRVFHWSLVALFAITFLTGDDIEWLHLAAGYGTIGLIALRIVWGFVGPRHARFSDFVRPPREVLDLSPCRQPQHLQNGPDQFAHGSLPLRSLGYHVTP